MNANLGAGCWIRALSEDSGIRHRYAAPGTPSERAADAGADSRELEALESAVGDGAQGQKSTEADTSNGGSNG
jgi:hypothetical protein